MSKVHNKTAGEEPESAIVFGPTGDEKLSEIELPACGGFKLARNPAHTVEALPAIKVTETNVRLRFIAVKNKFNELSTIRNQLMAEKDQETMCLGIGGCFCICLWCAIPAVSDRWATENQALVKSMKEIIKQINLIRKNFGDEEGWKELDQSVKLERAAFFDGLSLNLLYDQKL